MIKGFWEQTVAQPQGNGIQSGTTKQLTYHQHRRESPQHTWALPPSSFGLNRFHSYQSLWIVNSPSRSVGDGPTIGQ